MEKTKKILYYIKLWAPFLLWCLLIFVMSGIPNLRIKALGVFDLILRKTAHFTEYLFLCVLLMRALKGSSSGGILTGKMIFWSIFICIVYAVLDEYHQYFVPGRITSLFDVFVDSTGVIAGGRIYTVNYHKNENA